MRLKGGSLNADCNRKTQLAVEYCRQVRRRSPETWVLWIHASNAARCEKSLCDLADRARIPGRRDHNVNIFQLVGNWIRDENIGQWILALDNIDDDRLLRPPSVTALQGQASCHSNASTEPLLRYLLESSNGSIIATSRNKGVALEIAGHKNVIEVLPMENVEALDLLSRKLNRPTGDEGMVKLVEALEFMPLAIIQAAGYIIHRSPRCSVSQYLEKIRKKDHEAVRLLNYEAGLLYRDWEAKNSILLTWQISFDHIYSVRPSASGLLSLMSFFDRQGIPESIVRVQPSQDIKIPSEISYQQDQENGSEFGIDLQFENDIGTLSDYSFISVVEHGKLFTMHRLVQLTVRTWLKTHGQLEQWKETFINNLYTNFPTGEYENWAKCRSLFPHVKSAVSQQPESRESLQHWATLLYRGAWYAWQSGKIACVREMASNSRKQRVKLLGAEDNEALDSTAMLATAYWLEGHWEEAEKLQVQVMEIRKTKLGEVHPDTLTSMAELALTYRRQGRWQQAEILEVQLMETRKTKLGEDHPATLMSMANLALTYRNQGWWEEAENLLVQVLEIRKKKLGTDHPDTLRSMGNLAATYGDQGRWKEAEQLQVLLMNTIKTKLGLNHPDTLTNMANLAATYGNQGRWKEAEKLQVRVIERRKTKLGTDHPDMLRSMGNLAATYRSQGRWEQAEQLGIQAMETLKMKLGEDHPDTLSSMTNLAATYRTQGRWEEAEKLEMQAMGTLKTKLGTDHPDTMRSLGNLAATHGNQGRWEEAEKLQVQLVEMRKTKLGMDHPDTLLAMENLALTWRYIGRNDDAIDLLRDCVAKQQRILGLAHPQTLSLSKTLLEWELNCGADN